MGEEGEMGDEGVEEGKEGSWIENLATIISSGKNGRGLVRIVGVISIKFSKILII